MNTTGKIEYRCCRTTLHKKANENCMIMQKKTKLEVALSCSQDVELFLNPIETVLHVLECGVKIQANYIKSKKKMQEHLFF